MGNLAAGPGGVNETPTSVAFCETSDAKTKKIVEDALQPLAEKYIADAKTQGDEDPQLAFVIATEGGGLSDKFRELLNMASANPESPPRLMLVDIPDDGAYYEGPEGEITAAVVDQFASIKGPPSSRVVIHHHPPLLLVPRPEWQAPGHSQKLLRSKLVECTVDMCLVQWTHTLSNRQFSLAFVI